MTVPEGRTPPRGLQDPRGLRDGGGLRDPRGLRDGRSMRDLASRLWRRLDCSHLMAAHRRYSGAGGDALSSAVTYSLLLSLLPALLLMATGTKVTGGALAPLLGDSVGDAVSGAGTRGTATVLDAVPLGGSSAQRVFDAATGPVTAFGTVLAVYASLALFRAGRTAVRTLWGQPVGSGNPVRDIAGDVRDGTGLALCLLAVGTVTGLARAPLAWLGLAPAAADLGRTFVVVTCAAAYLYWRLPMADARVPARARWIAAAVGAVGLLLVTAAAVEYTRLLADARGAVYGALTALVAALIVGNVAVRVALRSLAWQLARHLPPLPEAAQPVPGHRHTDLWVVIPAHNEASGLPGTLAALRAQDDTDFTVVVVDNASTDGTGDVARETGARLGLRVDVVSEPRKGPWTALATGVAHAQDHGATQVLRTDADALPRPGWVAAGRSAFASGAEFLCGRVVPRRDEDPTVAERLLYPAVVRSAGLAGLWLQRSRRGAGVRYRTRYRLAQGPSMGFTTDLWSRLPGPAEGDLRTVVEDMALVNAARRQTVAVRRVEAMAVEASLRRLRAWGAKRLLLWHWDRRWTPEQEQTCDIR